MVHKYSTWYRTRFREITAVAIPQRACKVVLRPVESATAAKSQSRLHAVRKNQPFNLLQSPSAPSPSTGATIWVGPAGTPGRRRILSCPMTATWSATGLWSPARLRSLMPMAFILAAYSTTVRPWRPTRSPVSPIASSHGSGGPPCGGKGGDIPM